jgi:hypothetical protein
MAHPDTVPSGNRKNSNQQKVGMLLNRQAPGMSYAAHIVLQIEKISHDSLNLRWPVINPSRMKT